MSGKQEPPPARGRLSRDRILAAARAIAAAEGLGAVSMRRLGYELDVWPMSLYRHFRDKDELLDAIVDSAADEIAAPAGGSWRTRLTRLLADTHAMLGEDPEGLRTRFPRALETDGMVRVREAATAILTDAGLGAEDAAATWRALLAYAVGFAGLGGGEGEFEHGLELVLDGVEARLGAIA
ncbi:MAG: TetR/AcrR family transcriptional regulator [Actinomycetota bacterium]|nr:TetR/AcrR family transcriptional regulator [Actinomycetota bacterium]